MYDLAIIGGGPGGYVAAQRAAEKGFKVILFERNFLGGVCLNEGCIPTKSLLYAAKQYTHALDADKFGVHAADVSFSFGEIMARKEKVVKKLVAAIKSSMKHLGVEVIAGTARIEARNADGSFRICTDAGAFDTARILVCTGSSPAVPPIKGLGEENGAVLSSSGILGLDTMPESLTVIGGGVIGMEFAAFFNALGCKVHVIEMMPGILGPMDGELGELLRKTYEKRGVEFHLGCKVTMAEGNAVTFENPQGAAETVTSEKILVCVGRKPSFGGLGLENVGVRTGKGIEVDSHMRTNIEGIYAAGDVTGLSMLAHSASRQGEVAVNDMLGIDDSMSYDAIPSVVYTNPEIASVGLTLGQAAAKGIEAEVRKLPMTYSGRFVAETERENGLCKIVSERGSGKILGVQMLGGPCSEIISAACVALQAGLSVAQLQKVVFPHPSVSEILKETAFSEPLKA